MPDKQEIIDSLSKAGDTAVLSQEVIEKFAEEEFARLAMVAVPPPKTYDRATTDWEKELRPDEVIIDKVTGKPTVPLRALQRLSRLAKIKKSYPEYLGNPVNVDGRGNIQCVYKTEYPDGSVFGGAADVNAMNTTGKFLHYPTSVAESRAEARSHRKALGIQMLATEELIDTSEGYTGQVQNDNGKIDSQQVAVILAQLEDKNIKPITLIEAIVKDRECFAIEDMKASEGIAAMKWLNECSETKLSKRDAKKAALKSEVGES